MRLVRLGSSIANCTQTFVSFKQNFTLLRLTILFGAYLHSKPRDCFSVRAFAFTLLSHLLSVELKPSSEDYDSETNSTVLLVTININREGGHPAPPLTNLPGLPHDILRCLLMFPFGSTSIHSNYRRSISVTRITETRLPHE